LNGVGTIARRLEIRMSIVVLIFLGLIADAGVMLYFGWGLIDAVIAGSLFSYIAVTGLAGLTIATLVALIAAGALHAMFNEPGLKVSEVQVETFKGVVQLSGFVSSRADIKGAVRVASAAGGVKSVTNDMQLK
jgi:hypothetical protein